MYILKTTSELIFLLHVHFENNKWKKFPTTCTYWKQQVNWFSYYMYILKTTSELIFLLHVHIENNKWINVPTTCTYWIQQMN